MAGIIPGLTMARPKCDGCKCDYFSQDDFGYKFCSYNLHGHRCFINTDFYCPKKMY